MADGENDPLCPSTHDSYYLRSEWKAFDDEFLQYRTPLEAIVRGHFYIQAALVSFVESSFERPEAIDLAGIPFRQLVQLAHAVGVIEPEVEAGCLQLDDLRKMFVLDIDAELLPPHVRDLYYSLDPRFHPDAYLEKHDFYDQNVQHALVVKSIKTLYFGVKTSVLSFRELAGEIP